MSLEAVSPNYGARNRPSQFSLHSSHQSAGKSILTNVPIQEWSALLKSFPLWSEKALQHVSWIMPQHNLNFQWHPVALEKNQTVWFSRLFLTLPFSVAAPCVSLSVQTPAIPWTASHPTGTLCFCKAHTSLPPPLEFRFYLIQTSLPSFSHNQFLQTPSIHAPWTWVLAPLSLWVCGSSLSFH
jgi:hypothetical protein